MTNPATAQILQRISTLPPLPAAIGRLLRLVNNPDADFQEIARTIALDQTLTAQLLRIANSAFYGFSHQIRTVQQATVILGRHAVRNMALSLAMVTLRNRMKTDWPLTPEGFWRHSMGVACAARMLARHLRGADPEEAFVAGLLHDIGKIILMEYDTHAYKQLLGEAENGVRPLHELEREAFGIDHAGVGLALCQHWNIPDVLAVTTAAHHGSYDETPLSPETQQLVTLVHVSDALTKLAWVGNGGNPLVHAPWVGRLEELGLSVSHLDAVLEALPGEVASNEQIFFQTAGGPEDMPMRENDATLCVGVHLGASEHQALVGLTLRALHIRQDDGTGQPTAFILDGQTDAHARAALTATGATVLDFAQWRGRYAPSDWVNVHQLQNWLIQNFSAMAVAQ